MIYGDDVTHVVTEEGVAYLYKTGGAEERKAAIAAIAGATEIGRRAEPRHRGGPRVARRAADVYTAQQVRTRPTSTEPKDRCSTDLLVR